ncbi:MAG: sugar ABC transporter permease [Oscillospiraceae bacterium]|nr:sugar ABC transporter permease [Oscillospiraceae bacterium]
MKSKQRSAFSKGIRKHGMSIAFAAPFLLGFLIFTVIPVFIAVGLSFTRYDIVRPAQFVGLENYLMLFLEDSIFLTAFKNTMLFAVIYAPLSMLVTMGGAWLINDYTHRVRTILTFIFYAPNLTGGMMAIWALILNGDSYGILNQALSSLGLITTPIQWLSDTKYFFAILMIVSLWGCLGSGFLTFVAAFRGIDASLYEAAAMDGIKNRVQELWYITLPTLRPQLLYQALSSITGGFSVGALSASLFGNPSPQYAAHTIVLHMQDYVGTRMEYGTGCAIAVILFILQVGGNKLLGKFIRRIGT